MRAIAGAAPPAPAEASAYLFGSVAEDRSHRESDVDVAVLLSWEEHPDRAGRFDVGLRLAGALEPELARRVDVVVLNDVPPLLGRPVETTGRQLLRADPELDHAYARDVQIRAADVEPWLRRFRARKLEAIRRCPPRRAARRAAPPAAAWPAPERAPDALRRWYRDRMVASHDLLHVATGYDRDRPGEILLLAFTHAGTPKAVFRVAIGLGMLSVPLRWWPTFAIDVGRAWRRGRAAQVPRSTPWEELLPLSLVEVRRRLGIRPLAESHAGRIWRADPEGAWRRIPAAQAGG